MLAISSNLDGVIRQMTVFRDLVPKAAPIVMGNTALWAERARQVARLTLNGLNVEPAIVEQFAKDITAAFINPTLTISSVLPGTSGKVNESEYPDDFGVNQPVGFQELTDSIRAWVTAGESPRGEEDPAGGKIIKMEDWIPTVDTDGLVARIRSIILMKRDGWEGLKRRVAMFMDATQYGVQNAQNWASAVLEAWRTMAIEEMPPMILAQIRAFWKQSETELGI